MNIMEQLKKDARFRKENPELMAKVTNTLSYGVFYMHKLHEDIDRIQKGQQPACGEEYYMGEKLTHFLGMIEKIGIDKFKVLIEGISMDKLSEAYYLNI